MKTKMASILAVSLVWAIVGTGSAQAQYGCGGGYGYFDVGRLYRVLSDRVPYYAAFPPVYYSAPVPRTYGHSPFAYPPGTRTPDIAQPAAPLEIMNPHASETIKASTGVEDQVTSRKAGSQPLVVMNPYADRSLESGQMPKLHSVMLAH